MNTFPFMSASLRGSMALPGIGDPPDETGVLQAPDEAHVEAAVAADAPDQAGGRDVEEIVRNQLVRPDETGAVEAIGPDEAARLRRAGGPGDIVTLVVLAERDVGVGEQAVVIGDAQSPRIEPADAPDHRLSVGELLRRANRLAAQHAAAPYKALAPGEGLACDGRLRRRRQRPKGHQIRAEGQ